MGEIPRIYVLGFVKQTGAKYFQERLHNVLLINL